VDDFRICHIRNRPLFSSIASSTTADLVDVRLLIDYLQLPTLLADRIDTP
jgi:hypothetical protein